MEFIRKLETITAVKTVPKVITVLTPINSYFLLAVKRP